jgi:hypothetical protein
MASPVRNQELRRRNRLPRPTPALAPRLFLRPNRPARFLLQGESMDLGQFLPAVLFSSVIVFTLFMSDILSGRTPPFGTHTFIISLILVAGMSMGMVGSDELKRGGHRKVRRNLLVCLTVLFKFPLILAFTQVHMHWRIVAKDLANVHWLYWFIPFYVLVVAPFPVALYLNRKQKKSTSDPNNADAE